MTSPSRVSSASRAVAAWASARGKTCVLSAPADTAGLSTTASQPCLSASSPTSSVSPLRTQVVGVTNTPFSSSSRR
ncbi:hypothetical protein QEG98_05095 [Myxococcus sp. MxC21-1]|nr:hypothetical protein QEG98_05095 [Myxococcus sp. MxC21-1]